MWKAGWGWPGAIYLYEDAGRLWAYTGIGQIVGRTAFAPADLSFVGSATAVGDMTPDSPPGSDYAIFAIKGVDPDEAIAVKFLGVGKKGAEWVWLRYD